MHGKNHSLVLLIWPVAVCVWQGEVCVWGGSQDAVQLDVKHTALCLSTCNDSPWYMHTNKYLVVLDVSLFGKHCWVLVCNSRGAFLPVREDA